MRGQGTRRSTLTGLGVGLVGACCWGRRRRSARRRSIWSPRGRSGRRSASATWRSPRRTPRAGSGGGSTSTWRALAQRLGVPVAFVEYANLAARDAPAAAGTWDVASDARLEEAAARGWAAAAPYLDIDNTLVVGPTSALRSTADIDRPGVRIAAAGGAPRSWP